MGVNLSDIIEAREIEPKDLSFKTIAVDSFNWIYQFLSIIRDRFTGEPLTDSKGNITSHLSGLMYRSLNLLENNINPVFVFDGKPPKFKERTSSAREKIREEARKKWQEAKETGDIEKIKTYSQATSKLTKEMIEEAKKLLGYMGISHIQALSEGEAQCAFMCRNNEVFAVASQDFDSLAFGVPKLVRNLNMTGKRKVPRKEKYIEVKPEMIELDKALNSVGITRDQLIVLAILVGTDYNPSGIKGIGPKKALALVKEKKTLEKSLEGFDWEFDPKPQEIFDFFKNPPVEKIEIKKERFNPEKLRELMTDEHDFSKERVDKVIEKLEERENQSKQTGLGKFF